MAGTNHMGNRMVLVAAFRNREVAQRIAAEMRGLVLVASRQDTAHLPFDSLVVGSTDDLASFAGAADIGAWLACERAVKSASLDRLASVELPKAIGIFTMVAAPQMEPADSDRHWRDVHAPLALEIHAAMTHYYQLSLQHRFHGPEWHGFALCCFESEDDLRHRFYNGPEGEKAIAEDIRRFADTKRSPRRVVAHIVADEGVAGGS